ncbi:hypothetical protein GIY11_00165 [Aerococcaceae bacterium DSM 109653]|uniref:Uncharacterized protein n=1 Tax=Fundicoccus ignavus TaxID=2664442 RepID=A0A6I2GME4_9LACT|nr:hypothetical protein [Fundicoccus ignavus]MRI84695.1 hypothetical protein [Fundicoccus ignavus]MRJ47890.1 hypothetical protein [Fundicoccus ignavus]
MFYNIGVEKNDHFI